MANNVHIAKFNLLIFFGAYELELWREKKWITNSILVTNDIGMYSHKEVHKAICWRQTS